MKRFKNFLLAAVMFFGTSSGAFAVEPVADGAKDALGDPGLYHFFGAAPDTAGFSFLLLISDIGFGAPVEVITLPAPFTQLNSFTFAMGVRETKFLAPNNVGCAGTICTIYTRANAFTYSASLAIFGPDGGLAMPTPLIF